MAGRERCALGAWLALALASCGGGGSSGGSAPPATVQPTPTPSATATPLATAPATVLRADLRALFAQAQAEHDQLFPLDAQLNGETQLANRFGDYLSDAWYARLRAAAETNLARLSAIDRAGLTGADLIAYDAFRFNQQRALALFQPDIIKFERGLAMNHMFGIQAFYPSYAAGLGPIPFDTLADYENNLPRTREFARAIDATIGAFRTGAANGVFESRITIAIVIQQLDALLDDPVTSSPFYRPITVFPAAIAAADRTRLTAEYTAMITDDVYPALRRLRTYLADEYLAIARTTPGLAGLPGGRAYYDFLIEYSTSLDRTADQLHQTGLTETQRILARMEAIKAAQGFSGSLAAYRASLEANPARQVQSRQALIDRYTTIGQSVAARLPGLFLYGPKTALVIEPYDATREQFMFAASYVAGSPDGTRPGKFLFNGSQIGGAQISATSIYLHEGAPGHHFQISLAKEDPGLPAFMRSGLTSYVEGWALYAESLGADMGLFADPAAEFGYLVQELLRALRLVADTGLHDRGWSRQQAIDAFTATTLFGAGISSEIDRYIAIPGQALGYKVGEMEMQRLRDRAEAQLGTQFDIRRFHHQLLGTGAIPLPVLEQKVDRWIAGGGA